MRAEWRPDFLVAEHEAPARLGLVRGPLRILRLLDLVHVAAGRVVESSLHNKPITTQKATWPPYRIGFYPIPCSSRPPSSIATGTSIRFASLIELKSTYFFCAHMHEILKYFLFTENQKQCLNEQDYR